MKEKTECKKHSWIPLLGINKGKNVPTSLFTCLKCGDLKVGPHTIKISRFRMDMGELPLKNVAEINLMNPPTDQTASGLIVTANVLTDPEAIGVPLYMNADGDLDIANADSSSTSPCVALSLETGTGAKKVLVHGVLRKSTWTWNTGAGTAGLIYIADDPNGGTLVQSANLPNDTDDVIQPVGWALSTTSMYFAPSLIYLTHT